MCRKQHHKWQYAQFFYPDDLFTNWKYRSYSETVPDYEGPKKSEAEAILLLANGFTQQNSEVGKSASKTKSLILRNSAEPLCCGLAEVEAAESIDDLSTSASTTRIPDSGLRAILISRLQAGFREDPWTGNFRKQVTTAEGKTQSLKRSFTGRQTAWMIYEFFKISGDNEAILDFRDLSKVHLKNDNVQAFDTKWDKILSAVTDRPTDSILESLYKIQVEKSEELKYLLQVYAQDTAFGDKRYDCCRLKLMVQRHLEQKSKDYHIKARNRDEDRLAIGAQNKGEAKGKCKENAENNSERGDRIRWTKKFQCSFGEACTFRHGPKGRDSSLYKLQEKKLSKEKLTDLPCTNCKKRSCQRRSSCDFWHVYSVQNSKLQADTDLESSVHANRQPNLLMKKEIQQRLPPPTSRRMMNDRCNYGKFSRMTSTFSNGKN